MKYLISETCVYRLIALGNSSRHWWMFNLISGDLQPLRGWELKTQGLLWKASYSRRRNWPWQACFLGIIFNSSVLILLVTRLMTFVWVFSWIDGQLCWQMAVPTLWYPQLLASSAWWELGCVWMLYVERSVNMKRKWLQMQARHTVAYKCFYGTLKPNVTLFNDMQGGMFYFSFIKVLGLNW